MNGQSWIGKTIAGRYQIDDLLGQGGMSAVYSAYDPNLRRNVAIKLIHTHLSTDPNFIARFKEEAAAVARLRHPNIVPVMINAIPVKAINVSPNWVEASISK